MTPRGGANNHVDSHQMDMLSGALIEEQMRTVDTVYVGSSSKNAKIQESGSGDHQDYDDEDGQQRSEDDGGVTVE